jgi:LysM repeat protein
MLYDIAKQRTMYMEAKHQIMVPTFLLMLFVICLLTKDESINVAKSYGDMHVHNNPLSKVGNGLIIDAFKLDINSLKKPIKTHQHFYQKEFSDNGISREELNRISRVYGFPDGLLFYQNHIESNGVCQKTPNSKGAVGCFQFLRETAQEFGLITKDGDFTNDFHASADAAARYMLWLNIILYGDDANPSDWEQIRHVLAAYNAGYMRVKREGVLIIPKFYETVRYVSLIEDLVKGSAVVVLRGDTLDKISARTDVPVKFLLRGNHNVTSTADLKAGDVLSLPDQNGMTKLVVAKGMSLYQIKKRTGVSVSDLMAVNDLKKSSVIQVASILKIPVGHVTLSTHIN